MICCEAYPKGFVFVIFSLPESTLQLAIVGIVFGKITSSNRILLNSTDLFGFFKSKKFEFEKFGINASQICFKSNCECSTDPYNFFEFSKNSAKVSGSE